MNCTICGSPFLLGSDLHANCRIIEIQMASRAQRIDALLALFKDEIDEYLSD